MPEERRSAKRSRLAGLRATYEGADGTDGHADVFNISRAGLFLETSNLVAVGKRLSLEVRVTGEATPWPALGRVIWARASHDGDDRPCGMGVKLIDVEDAVVEAIDRLVDLREPTEPGIGHDAAAGSAFDQTILGVGTAVAPVSVAPISEEPVARQAMPTEPAPALDTVPAPSDDAIEPLVTPLVPSAVPSGVPSGVPSAMTPEAPAAGADPRLAIPLLRRSDDPEPLEPARRHATSRAPAQAPVPAAPGPAIPVAEAPPNAPIAAQAPATGGSIQKSAPSGATVPKRAVEASPDEPNPFAPPATKRGRRTWIAVLVAVVAIAAAAYVAHGLLQGG